METRGDGEGGVYNNTDLSNTYSLKDRRKQSLPINELIEYMKEALEHHGRTPHKAGGDYKWFFSNRETAKKLLKVYSLDTIKLVIDWALDDHYYDVQVDSLQTISRAMSYFQAHKGQKRTPPKKKSAPVNLSNHHAEQEGVNEENMDKPLSSKYNIIYQRLKNMNKDTGDSTGS